MHFLVSSTHQRPKAEVPLSLPQALSVATELQAAQPQPQPTRNVPGRGDAWSPEQRRKIGKYAEEHTVPKCLVWWNNPLLDTRKLSRSTCLDFRNHTIVVLREGSILTGR